MTEKQRALLESYSRSNPDRRFAASKGGCALGVWVDEQNEFVEFVMNGIDDKWVLLMDEQSLIYTTLCNGKTLYGPDDWEEYKP